jgi:phosphatidylglycerophosphatase A
LVLLLSFLIGVWSADRTAKDLNEKDSRNIVIDEFAGILVATFGITIRPAWLIGLAGLVLFRIFDRGKFALIKKAENIPGGLGIMLDDIIAGAVANLLIRITWAGIVGVKFVLAGGAAH